MKEKGCQHSIGHLTSEPEPLNLSTEEMEGMAVFNTEDAVYERLFRQCFEHLPDDTHLHRHVTLSSNNSMAFITHYSTSNIIENPLLIQIHITTRVLLTQLPNDKLHHSRRIVAMLLNRPRAHILQLLRREDVKQLEVLVQDIDGSA